MFLDALKRNLGAREQGAVPFRSVNLPSVVGLRQCVVSME